MSKRPLPAPSIIASVSETTRSADILPLVDLSIILLKFLLISFNTSTVFIFLASCICLDASVWDLIDSRVVLIVLGLLRFTPEFKSDLISLGKALVESL